MRLSLLSLSTISVSSLLFGLAFAAQKHKATWGLSVRTYSDSKDSWIETRRTENEKLGPLGIDLLFFL